MNPIPSTSGKQTQKVVWVLRLIEELEIVPAQYLKILVYTADIWEVRVQVGNNIFRLLGFFDGSTLLILTNAFAKKGQKTPRQEIELAAERKNVYLIRKRKI
jgi:phage-related protein